jgi:ketosteroid isomerase-like protein
VSQDIVEVARKILDEFASTHRAVERLTTPDFVWDMGSFGGWPEKQQYTGPEGFNDFFATWTAPYEDWDMEVQELRALDHDRVLVIVIQRGRPRGADSWVELHYGMIWTITGGLVSRAQVFGTREQVLKAAGLEE